MGANGESRAFLARSAMAGALQKGNHHSTRHWGRAFLRFGRREGSGVLSNSFGRREGSGVLSRSCTPNPRAATPAPAPAPGQRPRSITHPRY